jgi:hypothetical protein
MKHNVLTLSIAVEWFAGPVISPEVTDFKPNPYNGNLDRFFVA